MRLLLCFLLVMSSFAFASENVSVVLKVKFKSGGAVIDTSSKYVIDNLYTVLEEFPDSFIYIVGHTDSIGSSDLNMKLSVKRASHITDILLEKKAKSENIQTKGMGEKAPIATNATAAGRLKNRRVVVTFTQLNKEEVAKLKERLTKLEGFEIIEESNLVSDYIAQNQPKVEEKKEPVKKKSLRDLDRFSFELSSFHSELSSKVISGPNIGSLSDEVLSDVRVSTNMIQYEYFIAEKQYIAPLARFRWYEFSNEISNFLSEDETKYAFSLGAGYGYVFSERFRMQANLVWEQQLYYFSQGVGQAWTIDTENSIRTELIGKYIFFQSKYVDLGFGAQVAYLLNSGDLDNGHNWGAEIFAPFTKSKAWYAFTRYQVNTFDLNVSEIQHEILELGIGYKHQF